MVEAMFGEIRMPPWLGGIIHLAALPIVLGVVPWALSTLGVRHGWIGSSPGVWNLMGLVLVGAGFVFAGLCLRVHFAAAPQGWLLERTPHYPTPAYLLTVGPYSRSRNPDYMAKGIIFLGWIVFYGSLVLAGILMLAALILGPFVLPREERGLEARFGEAYRDYCRKTPRFLW